MGTDWKQLFQAQGAIWMHAGQAARPHALLTSGLHSDGFVNCTFVTQHPRLLQRIVTDSGGLAPLLPSQKVDWVIGSAFGAITLAYAVAERLGARAGFTEKDGEEMKLARFELAPGEKVLVVEDTISTGGSTLKTIAALLKAGAAAGDILPCILCLVNRSGSGELSGRQIRALITTQIHTWPAASCPLCQAGSEAVRPKTHWKELTA
ncbi:MAG: phosphoribosyltransferase family protein [Planctomycetota bacterium]